MEEQTALCSRYGIELDELESQALKLLHAKTGAAIARDVFGVDDEIYRAIWWHTTGHAGMGYNYLVLHQEEDAVYGTDFSVRWFEALQQNGVYIGSSGADDNAYYQMAFRNGRFEEQELGHKEGSQCEIAGKAVTEKAFQDWYAKIMKYLLLLLSPFAPHIVEELWENLGFASLTGKMACQNDWPVYDESKTVTSSVEMAVQINGKLKGTVILPMDSDEDTVREAALGQEKVSKAVEGMEVVKTIYIKNRLVNMIVKPAK